MCFRATFSVSSVSKSTAEDFGCFVSRDWFNRKARSTVMSTGTVAETEMGIATKHRRLLSWNFCSNTFIFRNIVCLFLSKGSNSQLILESLSLNGLRIKLRHALLLQSTHMALQRDSGRDHGVSLSTDNTKEALQSLSEGRMAQQHHTCLTGAHHLLFLLHFKNA